MTIAPGRYTAKVIDYGMITSANNHPMLALRFEVADEHQINYRSSFANDKAKEFTFKILKLLNFAGGVRELAAGPSSGCLDLEKFVEVEVEHREYEGRVYAEIKYINEIGGGGFRNRLSEIEAVELCAGIGLEADFAQAGFKRAAVVTKQPDLSEIPF